MSFRFPYRNSSLKSINAYVQDPKTAKPALRQPKPAAVTAVAGPSDDSSEFLKDRRWARVFIPTLTHALYISREPFVDFTSDSPKFLETVQRAFDLAFPNVDFGLSMTDKVMTTVR
jgi:hypothetical protein